MKSSSQARPLSSTGLAVLLFGFLFVLLLMQESIRKNSFTTYYLAFQGRDLLFGITAIVIGCALIMGARWARTAMVALTGAVFVGFVWSAWVLLPPILKQQSPSRASLETLPRIVSYIVAAAACPVGAWVIFVHPECERISRRSLIVALSGGILFSGICNGIIHSLR